MTYQRFEDLPVWKSAIELAEKIYYFTEKPPLKRKHSLRDQIERATLSISKRHNPGAFDLPVYFKRLCRRSPFHAVLL